jgi:2,3-bisphosphoglycerate-dependent phosphoglycerate mutase
MTVLFAAFIRHGTFRQPAHVPSAHLPYPLLPEGRIEAERGARLLAALIEQHELDTASVIDCSPLRRAWETATIVARVLGERLSRPFEVTETAALSERCLGSAANLTTTEIETIVADDPRYPALPPGWKRDPHFVVPFPGAESLLAAGERVASHVKQQTAPLCDRGLKLFVGHGGAFRHAAFHLGTLELEDLAALSMYCGEPVILQQSLLGWSHFEGRWKRRSHAAPEAADGAAETRNP